MEQKQKIGVIIGRFQVDSPTIAHKKLIDTVSYLSDKTVILLGISPVLRSQRNPLDYETRKIMLLSLYPNVEIHPLNDIGDNDFAWSKQIDIILSLYEESDITLYGARDSFLPYYHGINKTISLEDQINHNNISATDIRNLISKNPIDSDDFRRGVIYSTYKQYPSVYPTVDIALLSSDKQRILLGKKKHDLAFRLPGGFVDPTDENFESSLKREVKEECGDIEIDDIKYLSSFKVDDWRYKNEVHKIMTLLFTATYIFGHVQAGDDLAEVKWIETNHLQDMVDNNQIVKPHIPLINKIIETLKK